MRYIVGLVLLSGKIPFLFSKALDTTRSLIYCSHHATVTITVTVKVTVTI